MFLCQFKRDWRVLWWVLLGGYGRSFVYLIGFISRCHLLNTEDVKCKYIWEERCEWYVFPHWTKILVDLGSASYNIRPDGLRGGFSSAVNCEWVIKKPSGWIVVFTDKLFPNHRQWWGRLVSVWVVWQGNSRIMVGFGTREWIIIHAYNGTRGLSVTMVTREDGPVNRNFYFPSSSSLAFAAKGAPNVV